MNALIALLIMLANQMAAALASANLAAQSLSRIKGAMNIKDAVSKGLRS